MTPHEAIRPLLALSAGGLLDPDGERRVRGHILECPECAAHLNGLAALAAGLSAMPSPSPRWSCWRARRRGLPPNWRRAATGCRAPFWPWPAAVAVGWCRWPRGAYGTRWAAIRPLLIWLEFSAVLAGLTAAVVVRRRRRAERSFR